MEKLNVPMVMMALSETSLTMDLMDDSIDIESLFSSQEEQEEIDDTQQGDDNIDDALAGSSQNNIDTEGETLESVGIEEQIQQGREPEVNSQVPSTISSILTALKDDGILLDVDSELIQKAKSPEDFANIIEAQVAARLDATQQSLKKALDSGMTPDEIKTYQDTQAFLESIEEETLEDEDNEESMSLAKNLIYQDFLNRNFTPERAKKEIEKSIKAGTLVEDAKTALESNKDFYKGKYEATLREREEATNKARKAAEKLRQEFIKKTTETKEPFKGLTLDEKTRRVVLENATKPIKDTEGNLYTPVQKYIKENPNDAQYFMSLFYTLTDGFTNIDKLVGGKVKETTKKVVSNIEKVLNTSSRFNDSGNALFPKDEDSKLTDFKLDI